MTNLNDSGPGSLRAAIAASGPRTVVFRVGGIVTLNSPLLLTEPFITIAGQTAPGGGILLTGINPLRINTQHVIGRFLRIRNLLGGGTPGEGPSPMGIGNGAQNVILDHCSISWGLDDTQIWRFATGSPLDIQNITIQYCILAEGLSPHSTGLLVGGTDEDEAYLKVHEISVHHNLFVHNADRNPRTSTAGCQVINNVVYNWGSRVGVSAKKNMVDLINNYLIPGPMSQSMVFKHESKNLGSGLTYPDPSIYIAGNIVKGSFEDPFGDNWLLFVQDPAAGLSGPLPLSYRRTTPLPQSPIPVPIQLGADAYNTVLASVGASARLDSMGEWVSNTDSVDQRLLADVQNGTGWTSPPVSPDAAGGFPTIDPGIPYLDSDHDGMPDGWETANGLNPDDPQDANNIGLGGWTNLERFLNGPGG